MYHTLEGISYRHNWIRNTTII